MIFVTRGLSLSEFVINFNYLHRESRESWEVVHYLHSERAGRHALVYRTVPTVMKKTTKTAVLDYSNKNKNKKQGE
jgi:hypothetical protein